MSVTIAIQFLTGRYHATPWDKQVNEGVVEWPPSPWRILRSLVAAYYRLSPEDGLDNAARLSREAMLHLMEQLASRYPSYQLPNYTAAHSRHYMPLWQEGKSTTTKVLDTFYALPGGAFSDRAMMRVQWGDLDLQEEDRALLKLLCNRVSYLGRAESWVEMSVIADGDIQPNAVPISTMKGSQEITTRVLVPLNAAEMKGFVAGLAMLPAPKKGKGRWTAPQNVLESLETDIGLLHSQGWHGIPGSQWCLYRLEPEKSVRRKSVERSLAGRPAIARFGLSAPVLPKITMALSLGERFHQALIAKSRNEDRRSLPVFVGQDDLGKALQDDHAHGWYLSECNDRGQITHVSVYAPGGFEVPAVKALQGLKRVWGSEGINIDTTLLSVGAVAEWGVDRSGRSLCGGGQLWRSLTPMVLPRFPKLNKQGRRKLIPGTVFQVDGPEDQALRLLRQMRPDVWGAGGQRVGIDEDWLGWEDERGRLVMRVRVVDRGILDWDEDSQRYPAQRFQRRRFHGQGVRSLDRGYWLELWFESAVMGPIALGYGSHFGLGLLVCAGE
jgi:CRISPR-associated protein Csb2